jgi:DNA-binding XRE family transcriptional regulator
MADLKYQPVPHDHEVFLKKARKRKGFREAYKELDEEYALIREMLAARSMLGLTQETVAVLMGTTKSAVSRLETAGKHTPSLTTLKKYAKAVGCRLEIRLVPDSYATRKRVRGSGVGS